ncbi:MAG: FHA domain-containing protein [Acidimicrobiia bacterium]|nr:FHA domain-containing protein [Acidimicrobiia bacterium]
MPALVLNILKLIFLAFVYLFLWQIGRSIGAHIGPAPSSRPSRNLTELVAVRSANLSGLRFPLGAGVTIGRSGDSDVVIDDPYASEFHFRIAVQSDTAVLSDLGSTNGTYLNGRRVTVPTRLGKGDSIQIGNTILEVR